MQKQIEQVAAFQKAFGSTFSEEQVLLKPEEWQLRYEISLEELNEYKDACISEDKAEILDALLDRLWLILGDIVSHGFQDVLEAGFDEVARSNMSKLNDQGEPLINGVNCSYDPTRAHGKILKSKNFSPPNMIQFIK